MRAFVAGIAILCFKILCLGLANITVVNADSYTLYTQELPPYSIKQAEGITGVSVDIVSELFRRTEVGFKIKLFPLKRAYALAQKSPRSCIFPIQRTQERESSFKWVSPILITRTGLYSLPNTPINITVLDDAKAFRIGTLLGSADSEYLDALGFKVSEIRKLNRTIRMLQAKRISFWAVDGLTASYFAKRQGGTKLKLHLNYFTSLRALACNLSLSDDLIARLQGELKMMYRDGTVTRITDRYR